MKRAGKARPARGKARSPAPERVLWIDGSAGASGDMVLGALVDLGVPLAHLRRALATLPLEGWTLRARRLERCGLRGRKVDVRVRAHEHGRDWRAVRRIVRGGALAPAVRERALAIFRRLFEAEAEVHGRPVERVHLHEAGATDAIVDVVGAAAGLDYLRLDRIVVSPLTTGFGEVRCAHGVYPVPAPATTLLLRGVPARGGTIEAERLTPTGAAILTTIADAWGALPLSVPRAVGLGAGDRELGSAPNMLRMILGDSAAAADPESARAEVSVLECTLDDATPQALAFAAERLLDSGALDVFTAPVSMKKGRLGHHLTVLGRPAAAAELTRVLLRETSTFGVRVRLEQRVELERSVTRVRTRFGAVEVKVGRLDGRVLQAWPEYEQCAAQARRHGVPLRAVQDAALRAWSERES